MYGLKPPWGGWHRAMHMFRIMGEQPHFVVVIMCSPFKMNSISSSARCLYRFSVSTRFLYGFVLCWMLYLCMYSPAFAMLLLVSQPAAFARWVLLASSLHGFPQLSRSFFTITGSQLCSRSAGLEGEYDFKYVVTIKQVDGVWGACFRNLSQFCIQ